LSGKYESNKYYYPVTGGTDIYDINGIDYKLSVDENATQGRAYYEITPSNMPVNVNMIDKNMYNADTGSYGTSEESTELIYIYEPDRFYYEGPNPNNPL